MLSIISAQPAAHRDAAARVLKHAERGWSQAGPSWHEQLLQGTAWWAQASWRAGDL